MASVNYKVPPVFSSHNSYSRWIDEVKAWQALTDLDEDKRGLAIALSLPEEGQNSIRDKVFRELTVDQLNADDGGSKLIQFMDKIFKKDELSEAYEVYTEFDRFRRSQVSSMEDYVTEFEKLYNKSKKFKMELPQPVLAFKLLDCSELEMKDRQLVLTGVDYGQVDTLFKQMSTSLKKFFGQQAVPRKETRDDIDIKVECMAAEDVNYARNRNRRNFGYRGYNNNRGPDQEMNNPWKAKGPNRQQSKPINPDGPDGQPMRCRSCDSIRHLVKQCPHSYENLARQPVQKAVLFTGNKASEELVLLSESANSAILDSACTSTVAGEAWMSCYLDSLDTCQRDRVTEKSSDTLFKFGGGTVLQSQRKVTFPCSIAGVECEIQADVVKSDIPLLLSKDSMKRAKVKMDLENDSASIFGNDIQLQCTSSGHYCVPIHQVKVDVEATASAMVASDEQSGKVKIVEKLHKQFAHPTAKRLKTLLKDAGGSTEELLDCVDTVTDSCDVCKRYKKTPARPVVSLPLASEFNEVVALDLKEWKPNLYFLHLVDVATRFSLAAVVKRKTPEVIAEKIMTLWIGSGIGPPRKFLADNGGEFANEIFRDMCANLNIEVINTAAYSPWQNGICERNHAVVDDCVAKILEDYPNLNIEVALLWAVNAKNSLSMVYGWSPYQLVFGANPNVPNVLIDKPPALENTTVSQMLAKHLNALHSGRRAFTQAESSARIKRALRHKIRASGECFVQGDKVYFKRDDDHKWKGPGTVIGQDGKVVFVRHGSVYVRVPPCRLIRCGKEFCEEGKETGANERDNPLVQTKYSNVEGGCALDDSDSDQNEDKSSSEDDDDGHGENVEPTLPSGGTVGSTEDVVKPKVFKKPEQTKGDISKDDIPKVGDTILYKTISGDIWVKAKVMSKGGKATGKNKAYLNIKNEKDEYLTGIDFSSDVKEWRQILDRHDVNAVFVPSSRYMEDEVKKAKELELENWREFKVYEVVPNTGQKLLSTRWVITEKDTSEGKRTKARLVVRGFEEETEVKSDSPTVHKESLRIFLATASMMKQDIHSIDIKAAFLQGKKIDRDIYLQPPKESNVDESVVWKLNKCVYGLIDASRNWFLSVKSELCRLGCVQSKLDPALFYWYNDNKLEGIFLMHVDDFLWTGGDLFKSKVIMALTDKFHCGKELDNNFRYIGLNIEQKKGEIQLHQQDYTDELKQIDRNVTAADVRDDMYPEIVGQLHWIATQSRPDLSFDVLDLSTVSEISDSKLKLKVNKVVRKAKNNRYAIVFPSFESFEGLELLLYTEASYANLSDGVSSAGGHIIFLRGQNGKVCPISWVAKKIRRVVKSTLAAEALSLVDGLDACYFVRSILHEMLKMKDGSFIPIKCFTDNKSLCQNIHSTKLISEKRLRLDLASIKESVALGEIVVKWVKTSHQISDCLTKGGADFHRLIEILKTGKEVEK